MTHATSSGVHIDMTTEGAIRIALDAEADYLELTDTAWRELITIGYALAHVPQNTDWGIAA
jgi:hypothetical protein